MRPWDCYKDVRVVTGSCSPLTRATGEFLRKCGWLASTASIAEQGSKIAIAIAPPADSSKGADQPISCKLVVGSCQLSTVLEVVENAEFPDHTVLSQWHIHIGRKDFEDLQRYAWDSDICYLSVKPDVAGKGHLECLKYAHTQSEMMVAMIANWRADQQWASTKALLTHAAIFGSSMPCLVYLREVMGCAWDAKGSECTLAFQRGDLELLQQQYISRQRRQIVLLQRLRTLQLLISAPYAIGGMKPCYRCGDKWYLLAHVIREGSQFSQPCKALISPGSCTTVTRATGEFLRRCGWLASKAAPSKYGSEVATADGADSSKELAQLFHCKLVVGSCQLSTVLQVVEDVEFLDDSVLSRWHIHIGTKDFEAMERSAWDSDVCYLYANPVLGRGDPMWPPNCPLKCHSFTEALKNGHPDCLRHRHKVRVMS
ncbi:hypothetical protein COCOBI_10-0370 [Coccomyxa sp. Obi]|nr:hypothetical protein COCOBI_10-0370 [Coccomyxa sp. Obi]